MDGGPDYLPLPDEEEHGDDGDGGDDQDGDGGDGPGDGEGKAVDPSILSEMEKMEREGAEDVARRAELPPPPGLEGVHVDEPERKDKVYVEVLVHYSKGERGDGKVYLNDDGERVKIDKGGRPYRVDNRGFRKFHNSPRPGKFTPKEWQRIPHENLMPPSRKESLKDR